MKWSVGWWFLWAVSAHAVDSICDAVSKKQNLAEYHLSALLKAEILSYRRELEGVCRKSKIAELSRVAEIALRLKDRHQEAVFLSMRKMAEKRIKNYVPGGLSVGQQNDFKEILQQIESKWESLMPGTNIIHCLYVKETLETGKSPAGYAVFDQGNDSFFRVPRSCGDIELPLSKFSDLVEKQGSDDDRAFFSVYPKLSFDWDWQDGPCVKYITYDWLGALRKTQTTRFQSQVYTRLLTQAEKALLKSFSPAYLESQRELCNGWGAAYQEKIEQIKASFTQTSVFESTR